MKPRCQKDGCSEPAKTRGWCEPHYRYRLHTGRYGYQDAEPVREHVLKLRELGWTYEGIAKAAGTSSWTPHQLATGRLRNLLGETAERLMAVPLTRAASHVGVDPTGSIRRLRALAWMGWPAREIANRLGVKLETVYTIQLRGGGHGRLSSNLAAKIVAVYDELSLSPGLSRQTASKARSRGYSSPLAWDDDIDDPSARPHSGDKLDKMSPVEIRGEIDHLYGLGVSEHEIAKKLNLSANYVRALRLLPADHERFSTSRKEAA